MDTHAHEEETSGAGALESMHRLPRDDATALRIMTAVSFVFIRVYSWLSFSVRGTAGVRLKTYTTGRFRVLRSWVSVSWAPLAETL
jgi:hypothetical protein